MKSAFHSLLTLCFFCLLIACNPNETPSQEVKTNPVEENTSPQNLIEQAASIEEKIKTIRSLYKNIQDNLNKYSAQEKSYKGDFETPIVGKITAYMNGDKLVKLVDKAEEDHGPARNEYYFTNGTLFFLFSQVTTVEMTEEPNQHVRELRLYFDQGNIIDALVKTKTFKSGETIDMSIVANGKGTDLVNSKEESEYYSKLANETLEFFRSDESFNAFYGEE